MLKDYVNMEQMKKAYVNMEQMKNAYVLRPHLSDIFNKRILQTIAKTATMLYGFHN